LLQAWASPAAQARRRVVALVAVAALPVGRLLVPVGRLLVPVGPLVGAGRLLAGAGRLLGGPLGAGPRSPPATRRRADGGPAVDGRTGWAAGLGAGPPQPASASAQSSAAVDRAAAERRLTG